MSRIGDVLIEVEAAMDEVGDSKWRVVDCLREHGALIAAEYVECMPSEAWMDMVEDRNPRPSLAKTRPATQQEKVA
jgi:hypothetical protein